MAELAVAAQIAAVLLLLGIAVHDARAFRIRNGAVIAMLSLYFLAQGTLLFPTWRGDLFAGILLFGLGLIMWLLRGLGAGDAKLMFPLGLLLGFAGLMPFAVLLLAASILLYGMIMLCAVFQAERGIGGWFARMKSEGRVPYGVPLALAAIPVLIAKAILTG